MPVAAAAAPATPIKVAIPEIGRKRKSLSNVSTLYRVKKRWERW